MKLKVRELREYLILHGISTHLCREKVFFTQLIYDLLIFKLAVQLVLFLLRRNW